MHVFWIIFSIFFVGQNDLKEQYPFSLPKRFKIDQKINFELARGQHFLTYIHEYAKFLTKNAFTKYFLYLRSNFQVLLMLSTNLLLTHIL